MSSTTPPGWYDDGSGRQRWWDGTQWGPEQPAPVQPVQPQSWGQQPYQPPAQSPYQPGFQPGYGAPAPKPRRTGLVVGLVVAVVLVVAGGIVATVLLLGSDDDSTSEDQAGGGGGTGGSSEVSGSPEDTVDAYLSASYDGDCEAALDTLAGDLREFLATTCDSYDLSIYEDAGIDVDDIVYEFGDVEIDGDSAVVPVTVSGLPTPDQSVDYYLEAVDGSWVITRFAGSGIDSDELADLGGGSTSGDAPSEPS